MPSQLLALRYVNRLYPLCRPNPRPFQIYTRKQPYPNIRSDRKVIDHVLAGGRPPQPMSGAGFPMSDVVWTIVQTCWSPSPFERPHISEVVRKLTVALRELHSESSTTTGFTIEEDSPRESVYLISYLPPLLLVVFWVTYFNVIPGLVRDYSRDLEPRIILLVLIPCHISFSSLVLFSPAFSTFLRRMTRRNVTKRSIQMFAFAGLTLACLATIFTPLTNLAFSIDMIFKILTRGTGTIVMVSVILRTWLFLVYSWSPLVLNRYLACVVAYFCQAIRLG